MCSFTNFSSNKNVRFFVKEPKSSYESYLSSHTSESLKNIVKILETRPQSSNNAQKWTKICNIHDVDKISVWFSITFLCSILKPSTLNIKKCWDKTVLKTWSQMFEKKSQTTFSKQFSPNNFLCLLC